MFIIIFTFFYHNWFQVIVDGTYALHAKLRSLLDIRVAVVIFFFFLQYCNNSMAFIMLLVTCVFQNN